MIGLIWAQQYESGYDKTTGDILILLWSKLVTLAKVSQCPLKATNGAFSLLKAPK